MDELNWTMSDIFKPCDVPANWMWLCRIFCKFPKLGEICISPKLSKPDG